MKDLTVTLIQYDIIWEDAEANLNFLNNELLNVPNETHIVILPEMFATGFSMQPEKIAQTMDGSILTWMRKQANQHRKIIAGSVAIEEDGQYFNRLIWMLPNGIFYSYDKRHLFSYAGEQEHYVAGNQKTIVQVNGWKICLNVCYDLRFPVWLRQPPMKEERYDILLFVANWPERRSFAWQTLLKARAIENLCYTIGVNRIGSDNKGIYHSGDSCIINPLGDVLEQSSHAQKHLTYTFKQDDLNAIRSQYKFLDDADNFILL